MSTRPPAPPAARAVVIADPQALPARIGTGYPAPYAALCQTREKRALGDAGGLQNFGVNLVTLPPGQGSAHRHWHTRQDEFVWVLEGTLTLVTDAGETQLKPGQCACFPAGAPDGHHLVNKSAVAARYLEVGDRLPGDAAVYPDIDMRATGGRVPYSFTRKDGSSF